MSLLHRVSSSPLLFDICAGLSNPILEVLSVKKIVKSSTDLSVPCESLKWDEKEEDEKEKEEEEYTCFTSFSPHLNSTTNTKYNTFSLDNCDAISSNNNSNNRIVGVEWKRTRQMVHVLGMLIGKKKKEVIVLIVIIIK
jgi:hypothetical protein